MKEQQGVALISVLVLVFIAALIALHVMRMVVLSEHFDHNISAYQKAVTLLHLAERKLVQDSRLKRIYTHPCGALPCSIKVWLGRAQWHTLKIGSYAVQYAVQSIYTSPLVNQVLLRYQVYQWTFYWHDPNMVTSSYLGVKTT